MTNQRLLTLASRNHTLAAASSPFLDIEPVTSDTSDTTLSPLIFSVMEGRVNPR